MLQMAGTLHFRAKMNCYKCVVFRASLVCGFIYDISLLDGPGLDLICSHSLSIARRGPNFGPGRDLKVQMIIRNQGIDKVEVHKIWAGFWSITLKL